MPTCTEEGETTYTCSNCSDSYTQPIAKKEHTVQHVAAKMPTLEAAGNIEHWYCTSCLTYWKDAEKTTVTTKDAVILPKVEAGNVAYMNGTAYATLAAAVTAAENSAGADTIYLLTDATITAQLKPTTDITIKADKAVTIQISESVTGSVIYVTNGNLNIIGASESATLTETNVTVVP